MRTRRTHGAPGGRHQPDLGDADGALVEPSAGSSPGVAAALSSSTSAAAGGAAELVARERAATPVSVNGSYAAWSRYDRRTGRFG